LFIAIPRLREGDEPRGDANKPWFIAIPSVREGDEPRGDANKPWFIVIPRLREGDEDAEVLKDLEDVGERALAVPDSSRGERDKAREGVMSLDAVFVRRSRVRFEARDVRVKPRFYPGHSLPMASHVPAWHCIVRFPSQPP
jgi:hypothetical protein